MSFPLESAFTFIENKLRLTGLNKEGLLLTLQILALFASILLED